MNMSTDALRQMNAEVIRGTLRSGAVLTKAEIAAHTGLSYPTCNTIVNELMAGGEVLEQTHPPSGSGRPATLYRYNPDWGRLLCLNLTDDDHPHARFAAYNPLGACTLQSSSRFGGHDLPSLLHLIEKLAAPYSTAKALAVSIPGTTMDGRRVDTCDIPCLQAYPLADTLEKMLGLPVRVENDMNLAALGLSESGEAPAKTSIAVVYFSKKNCPGAGLLADGRILRGATGFAGEVGWLPSIPDFSRPISRSQTVDMIYRVLLSIIAVFNPHTILVSGELLAPDMIPEIEALYAAHVPSQFLPQLLHQPSFEPYILRGLYTQTLQSLAPPKINI